MAGRLTVLTPNAEGNVVELGRKLFRKQLIPRAKIQYGDRELDFDEKYISNLAQSFRDRAFDTCPLVMADERNQHTMSPTAATGEIVGVEETPDGLDILVSADDAAAKVLSENPRVGVSARIVEDFARSDGKTWPAALQHALITFAPRIPGLRPWEPIECSEETADVIDLSALVFTADGSAVTPPTTSASDPADGKTDVPPQKASQPMAPQITEEELAAVRSVVSLLPTLQKLVAPDEGGEGGDTVKAEVKPDATVTPIKPAPKVDPAAEVDEDPEAEQVIAAATADDDSKTVDLALVELRTARDRQAIELAELRAERDNEKWNYEREQLVRDYGIPPAIVNLAEPLLKGAKHVVELSDGGSVDAGAVLRSVLHNVAKTYGRKVDLSAPTGSALEADAEDEAKAARDRIHAAARAAGFGQ